MRQWLRSHLTYANVMATIAVFLVLGGGTAVAAFVVSSNSQIGPGTVSGHKPPSGDHANVIAGSVNGQDVADNSLGGADINEASLTGDTLRLNYNASGATGLTTIGKVGPFTIQGSCFVDARTTIHLFVSAASGTADVMFSRTLNDNTDLGNESRGLLIPSQGVEFASIQTSTSFSEYRRIGGTAMLRTGSTTVQVDFNAVADNRGAGSCFMYGTGTRAT